MNEFPMREAGSQVVLYTTDDGKTKVSLMSQDGRVSRANPICRNFCDYERN